MWKEGQQPEPTETRCLMLSGKVGNPKGKGIKAASITVTDPAGSDLNVLVTTEKNGTRTTAPTRLLSLQGALAAQAGGAAVRPELVRLTF